MTEKEDQGGDDQTPKAKTVVRPLVCPFCGSDLDTVRHVIANIYEVDCLQCNVPAVIHSGDQIALPSLK